MANTYTQLYIQIVFAVKGRQNLIDPAWKEHLNQYIAGIIRRKGHKPIIVNGMPDHIHIFIGLAPSISISDLVRDIKCNSSKYINEQNYAAHRFSWQEGFGAFSYARTEINRVYQYILNQEKHHRQQNFREEFTGMLEEFEIEYEEKYMFDWLE